MEDFKDAKIREYFSKDKIMSEKANRVFENFIEEINKEEENKGKRKHYKMNKFLSIAASLVVVLVGANVYARTQGYDNIFFMIKEIYTQENGQDNIQEEIFTDRDIIISYQSFNITDDIEMQVNELQVKENKAKLYLHIKENDENSITPFYYKVYNDNNELMCEKTSDKQTEDRNYKETLELKNYEDDTNIIKLEVYSNEKKLLKTVSINLEEKLIEAKTEGSEIEKISQVKLNELIREETKNNIITNDKQNVLVLQLTDISYSNSIYSVKYLYNMPTNDELENGEVEQLQIFQNSIKFKIEGGEYKILEMSTPEKVDIN